MRFFDYIRLALKNLFRQKLRTFLTVLAITVGSLSLILMATILIGLRQTIVDQLQQMGAFKLITVLRDPNAANSDKAQIITNGNNLGPNSNEGKIIDDNTVKLIKQIPDVVDATPTLAVWFKTMKLENNDKKVWANIMAYDPTSEVFELPIKEGRNLMTSDMDKIVIGTGFLEEVGYNSDPKNMIGKYVVLNYEGGGGSAPDWGPLPEQPPENADKTWWEAQSKKGLHIKAEIVGIADSKMGDTMQSYITLTWGKRLMTEVRWEYDKEATDALRQKYEAEGEAAKEAFYSNPENSGKEKKEFSYNTPEIKNMMKIVKEDRFTKDGYGSVILKVRETDNIKEVVQAVEKMGYGATTAEKMLAQVNKIIGIIGILLSVIGGISLFVAAIGIINTMIMATYERTKEIGVMRACGATRAAIRRLFTIEAGLLGFGGGVFGFSISFILLNIAQLIVDKNSGSFGNLPLDKINNFPLWLIVAIIGFTTVIGTFSGLYPAIRAARLNPVDALRYE